MRMNSTVKTLILIVIVGLIVLIAIEWAGAAEFQEIVEFKSLEQLPGLLDSVIGVCDTSWEGWWPCLASDTSIVEYSDWLGNVKRSDSCYMYFFRPIITHREFVRMEVRPILWTIGNDTAPRVKAIILWKEVFVAFGEYDPLRGGKDE